MKKRIDLKIPVPKAKRKGRGGRPVLFKHKTSVLFQLDRHELVALKAEAERRGTSVNSLLRAMVLDLIG